MTAAPPIYRGHQFYVPRFEITLDERPVGSDVVHDVVQVTYSDDLQSIDHFEITINNWDAETRTLKYSDEDLFDPKKTIAVYMGYYGEGDLTRMMRGEITALRPTYPASGQPTLTISGQNILHSFRKSKETHTYQKMTDSQIAQAIGRRLGITVKTDPMATVQETPHDYVVQRNELDLPFLLKRAETLGYAVFVEEVQDSDDSILYFGPRRGVKRTSFQLVYGRSLIDFQPNLDATNQVGEVAVQGWDKVNKKPIKVAVKRDELNPPMLSEALEKDIRERREVISDHPVENEPEAQQVARGKLERIIDKYVTGHGSTVGVPSLRAGSLIEIGGLGTRFSGRYFVTATTHTIGDSGYTTQFECEMREQMGS